MAETSQEKTNSFASYMLDLLNGSMLSLMLSIGYKTELFELMAGLPPSASAEIASKAGLNERYVREWLAAMVAGRIIDYDPAADIYTLPAEHASVITSAAGQNNMARFAQIVPLLASVESGIVDAFQNGGGVPYSAYMDFMNVWAEVNTERFDATLIESILPLMPDVVAAMHRGIDVLDVGCGNGHVLNLMAKAFPKSRFTGFDFLEEVVTAAKAEAQSLELSNVVFETVDVETFDRVGEYGFILANDTIHDMARPAAALEAVAAALAANGTFLMIDIAGSSNLHENLDHPLAPWLYTTSCLHCMTVSLALGGVGLGMMWGEQKAVQLLHEAGFLDVDVRRIPEDAFNNYYVARKGV